MGIYPDHGLEYRVALKDNKYYVIASSKEIDDRLSKSLFYKKRMDTWFAVGNSFSRILSDEDVADLDFDLTEDEKNKLQKFLTENGDKVESHGWYDVCSVYDTYGSYPHYGEEDNVGYFVLLKDGRKIKVSKSKTLNDHEIAILKGIFNVYDDQVIFHGYNS